MPEVFSRRMTEQPEGLPIKGPGKDLLLYSLFRVAAEILLQNYCRRTREDGAGT